MKKSVVLCCIFMFSMLLTNSAQAQGVNVAVGLGAAAAHEFEGSDDYEGVPLVFLNGKWDNNMSVLIMGNAGRINLVTCPDFENTFGYRVMP